MTFEEDLDNVLAWADCGIHEFLFCDEIEKEYQLLERFKNNCLDKQRVVEAIELARQHYGTSDEAFEVLCKELGL